MAILVIYCIRTYIFNKISSYTYYKTLDTANIKYLMFHNYCLYTLYIVYIGPPTIIYIDHNTISLEGNKSDLICIATNDEDSDQPLKIQWYNSSGIQVSSDETRILINSTIRKDTGQLKSELLFDPVNRTDSGVYICRAFNDPNCFAEKNVKLTVECKFILCIHMISL